MENMINDSIENVTEDTVADVAATDVAESGKEAKKPGKVGAVFYGLLLMVIYLVIVSVAQLFALVPIVMEALSAAQAGDADYQSIYMQKVVENASLVSVTTFVGTVLAAATVALWYYFGVYKKSVKAGTYESVLPKLKNGKSIGFIVSITLAGYSFATLIERLLMYLMPQTGEVFEQTLGAVMGGVSITGFIMTVLIAPIGEEVCIRGLTLYRAKKSFGLVGCMVLSGILFGIYHMNPIQGIYAIPLGMIFAYVGYKYNSVIPCIICHIINNLIAAFSGLLGFTDTFIVPISVLVVGAVFAVIFGRKANLP